MRRRRPSPVQPFDSVPDAVVEAARRVFDAVWARPFTMAWSAVRDRFGTE